MLQATAIPAPTVAAPTPSPLCTLHLVPPVNFMQDPTNSLPLMLKCFTRQHLLSVFVQTCLLTYQLSRTWFGKTRNESDHLEVLI